MALVETLAVSIPDDFDLGNFIFRDHSPNGMQELTVPAKFGSSPALRYGESQARIVELIVDNLMLPNAAVAQSEGVLESREPVNVGNLVQLD